MVAAGMPASSWSCRAARAANEQPITRYPDASHARRAAASANVLPAPATPSTTSISVPRPADRPNHRPLLFRQRPSSSDGGFDCGRRCDTDTGGPAVEG